MNEYAHTQKTFPEIIKISTEQLRNLRDSFRKSLTGIYEIYNGSKPLCIAFLKEGAYHRIDGPAVIYPSLSVNGLPSAHYWYINGEKINKFEDIPDLTKEQLLFLKLRYIRI